MLVPAAYCWGARIHGAGTFVGAAGITGFVAGALIFGARSDSLHLNVRQMYLLTALAWVTASFFGALPFAFHGIGMNLADAYFETVSGLTTTGSTVMTGLDKAPADILLWRALLQWLGGLGIIVMAMVALPVLRVGGMQLFHTESSDRSEKVFASTAQFIRFVMSAYLLLSLLCVVAYALAGMSFFDAVLHAMTTLSTGGYSTHDASLGRYANPAIHWIAIFFMLSGALPFVLYVQLAQGKRMGDVWQSQVTAYLAIILVAAAVIAAWLWLDQGRPVEAAIRHALFTVVSIVTTTGYASSDYMLWGGFPIAIIFVLMYVGGCTGSTAGGIKVFRLQVIYLFARAQVTRQIMPNRVVATRLDNRDIDTSVASSVLAFVGLYVATVAAVTIVLSVFGLDFLTALSSAVTAIGNVGPGLGDTVGPAGNFGSFSDAAKLVTSAAMLLGRLELMTVLVVLTPFFWREW
jgi:trk system potassium uptake protein TrkH